MCDVSCLMQVPGTGHKLKDVGLPSPPLFLLPFIGTDTLTLHARRLLCLGSLLQLLCDFAPNSFKADLMKKTSPPRKMSAKASCRHCCRLQMLTRAGEIKSQEYSLAQTRQGPSGTLEDFPKHSSSLLCAINSHHTPSLSA